MAQMTLRCERRKTVGEDLWRWVLEVQPLNEMPYLWSDRYAEHDGRVTRIYSEARHLGAPR